MGQLKHTTKAARAMRRSSSPEQRTSRLDAQLQKLEETIASVEADPDLQTDEKITLGRCYQERRELLQLQLKGLPEAETAAMFAQSLLHFESSEGGKRRDLRSVQSLARGRAMGSGWPSPERDYRLMREGTPEQQALSLQRRRSKEARDHFEAARSKVATLHERETVLKAGEKKRAAAIRQVMKARDTRKRAKEEQEERAANKVSAPQLPQPESPMEAPPASAPPSSPSAALVEPPALGEDLEGKTTAPTNSAKRKKERRDYSSPLKVGIRTALIANRKMTNDKLREWLDEHLPAEAFDRFKSIQNPRGSIVLAYVKVPKQRHVIEVAVTEVRRDMRLPAKRVRALSGPQ